MKKINTTIFAFLVIINLSAQVENALHFDGTDDNVTVPNASSLISNATQFSMSCWIYPENGAPVFPDYDGFCGFRNNLNADFYLVQLSNNYVEARFTNSHNQSFDIIDSSLVINAWQQYVFVFDGNQLYLYYNGQLSDTIAATGAITSATESFFIGNLLYSGNNFYMNGKIDEVSLWSRALTASEVACIYQGNIDTLSAGLQLYYKFDQGVAGGNNASVSVLNPNAGSINGVLNNFALSGATSNWIEGIQNFTAVSDTFCPGQPYFFGFQSIYEPGTYSEVFTAGNGCDSIVKLNLNSAISVLPVVQSGPQFTILGGDSTTTYQWIDCDNGNSIITGETSNNFTASTEGNYAAIVTKNSCTDTTACYYYSLTGAPDQASIKTIEIFPNPSENFLSFSGTEKNSSICIFDLSGREVISTSPDELFRVNISFLSEGMYLVRIRDSSGVVTKRIVKR